MAAPRVEYLDFEDDGVSSSRRTRVVRIVSRRSGAVLGVIKWYGPWRGYVADLGRDVVWSPDCLVRVAAEVRTMTDRHRRLLRERKP